MRYKHGSEFFRVAGAQVADFLERCEQAVQSAVLAEEQDFVFAAKIVVEIGGGEVRSGSDVPHAGGKESAGAKLTSRGAQNLEAAGEPPPAKAAVSLKRGSGRQNAFLLRRRMLSQS